MKAVIHCVSMAGDWPGEFFPRWNAYLLPFLGKPLLEFYVDACSLCGVDELLVLQEDYDAEVAEFLGDGSNWGVKISHATSGKGATGEDVLRFNSGFVKGAEVLFFDGLFFPFYDKHAHVYPDRLPTRGPLRLLGAKGDVAPDDGVIRPLPVCTLRDFYRLNMMLLEKYADGLVMKGYGAERGVFFGMNDVVSKGVNLAPPFVIGNNVSVDDDAEIGPMTILGDTCIVDKRTRLTRSVVFDKTYVGADLEVDGKIVAGGTIIDPESEVAVEFKDNYFVSRVRIGAVRRTLWRARDILLSLFLALCGLPFFLLFRLIGEPPHVKTPFRTRGGHARPCHYPRFGRDGGHVWFFRFSVDKFIPLCLVLSGKMRLVGDTLWDTESESGMFKRYKNYHAGAFTYADSLGHHDPYECLIDDLYYAHNRSLKTDLQLLLRSYLQRLFEGE